MSIGAADSLMGRSLENRSLSHTAGFGFLPESRRWRTIIMATAPAVYSQPSTNVAQLKS